MDKYPVFVDPIRLRVFYVCMALTGAHARPARCSPGDIDPATYLTDVLQRVGQHPASRVAELTPLLWKQHFAANPQRSDLHASAT